MTEIDNLKQEVKLEIQSLLCTEKAAITSRRLHGLYMSEIGTAIPYAKLGYKCMDDLLKSMPDVVSSFTNFTDGMLYVKAVPLKGSSHINELVRGQRTHKPKTKKNNGYSLNSKFRGFRVSSQIAPNRNFNKNYNSLKPLERYDNNKTGNVIRPQSCAIPDNRSKMLPQLMQPKQQTSLLGTPLSTYQVNKPTFSIYNQRGLLQSMSNVTSNNTYNMNSNMNQIFTKQQNLVESKVVALPLNVTLNSTAMNNPRELPGRAHMTPQLMQPRTPTTPQLMQPQTPINQAQPATAESQIGLPPRTKIVLPMPHPPVLQSSAVDPVQKSLANLNISLKEEELKSSKQVSVAFQRLPKPSTSQAQPFPPPTEQRTTNSKYFEWKLVEPKPVQASVKPVCEQFHSPAIVQPTIPGQTCTVAEENPKGVQENIKPTCQQFNRPDIIHPSSFDRTYTAVEEKPSRLSDAVQPIKPATPPFNPKLSDPVQPELSTTRTITPSARAPRTLLRNAIPIVSPARRCIYRPDNTIDSVPLVLPTIKPTTPLPASPSPLLSRRVSYRSSEFQSVPPTVVSHATSRPSVRPAVPSDRLAEFYCERLKTLVTSFNFGKVTLNHNELKSGRFIASIKVGQEMFITYPKDFESVTDAYEDAARQAVIHFEATPNWMQPI